MHHLCYYSSAASTKLLSHSLLHGISTHLKLNYLSVPTFNLFVPTSVPHYPSWIVFFSLTLYWTRISFSLMSKERCFSRCLLNSALLTIKDHPISCQFALRSLPSHLLLCSTLKRIFVTFI